MNLDKEQLTLFQEFILQKQEEEESEVDNCLSEMLNELMKQRNVELADIQRETGIKWSTLLGIKNKKNRYQKLNTNILKLARYFKVSIDYLGFGVEPLRGGEKHEHEQSNNHREGL